MRRKERLTRPFRALVVLVATIAPSLSACGGGGDAKAPTAPTTPIMRELSSTQAPTT